MRIAILCPGPSLARHEAGTWDDYDLTIAVNRAAKAHACHWWVFGDAEGFRQVVPSNTPCLFTSRQAWEELQRTEHNLDGRVLAFEGLPTGVPWDYGWHRHSMIAAMVLAEYLIDAETAALTAIDLFGCDWEIGADYFDGSIDPIAQNAHRFVNERHAYGRVRDWITQKRIELRRAKFDYAGVGNG